MAEDPVAPSEPEPYQSLYRRYRPQRFEDVLGQEHVTRALRNSVRDGRVAHAYLFSGPRGTGKTSTARILAMALNCEHPADGEPDGTCPSCVEIRRGSSVDVHELDAASNRKLDEMRDLLSRVALGTRGRSKVYIIDEVHQLTGDAASALLKTLEEPPGHVVFVLATTDPQRVLPTIRSRTQHFEFRLLPSDVMESLLRGVNQRAGLGLAADAIEAVVRRGHGSARDALSVLDQVAASGTVDDDSAIVSQIVDGVADRDPGRVLVAVAEAIGAGRDPRRLAADILELLRNGFLATQARQLVLLSDDAVTQARDQAQRLGLPRLVRALEVVGEASADMRDAVDTRITLEVALVRLAAPAADESPAALAERITRLEHLVAAQPSGSSGTIPAPPGSAASPAPAGSAAPAAGSSSARPTAAGGPGPASAAPDTPDAPEARSQPGASAAEATRQARSRLVAPGRSGPPPGPAPSAPSRPAAPPPRLPPPPGPPPSRSDRRLAPSPRPDVTSDRASVVSRPQPVPPAPGSADSSPATSAGREAVPSTSQGGRSGAFPTRDQLTTAWGDQILSGLRPGVKVYLSLGRFIAVEDDVAVMALPDQGLLRRAEPVKGEAEAALAAHFGRSVPLRLVVDEGAAPPAEGAVPPPTEDDPDAYQFHELEDADTAVMSPEQRLLQAFPGAEEVHP